MKLPDTKCEGCGSEDIQIIDRAEDYDRYVCYNCGLKFRIRYE